MTKSNFESVRILFLKYLHIQRYLTIQLSEDTCDSKKNDLLFFDTVHCSN